MGAASWKLCWFVLKRPGEAGHPLSAGLRLHSEPAGGERLTGSGNLLSLPPRTGALCLEAHLKRVGHVIPALNQVEVPNIQPVIRKGKATKSVCKAFICALCSISDMKHVHLCEAELRRSISYSRLGETIGFTKLSERLTLVNGEEQRDFKRKGILLCKWPCPYFFFRVLFKFSFFPQFCDQNMREKKNLLTTNFFFI